MRCTYEICVFLSKLHLYNNFVSENPEKTLLTIFDQCDMSNI